MEMLRNKVKTNVRSAKNAYNMHTRLNDRVIRDYGYDLRHLSSLVIFFNIIIYIIVIIMPLSFALRLIIR